MARLIALVSLRFKLLVRGIRGGAGKADAAVGILLALGGVVGALLLAWGLGWAAGRALTTEDEQVFRIKFYILFF